MAEIKLSIPSTFSPSHKFRLSAGRTRRGAFVSAQEGEVSEGCFSFRMDFSATGPGPGSRRRSIDIPGGRLTAKAIAAAATELAALLVAEGLAEPVPSATIAAAIH